MAVSGGLTIANIIVLIPGDGHLSIQSNGLSKTGYIGSGITSSYARKIAAIAKPVLAKCVKDCVVIVPARGVRLLNL